MIRADLRMGKGKLAAHAAHASLEAYKLSVDSDPDGVLHWEAEGGKKVVLKIGSEAELLELFRKIKRHVPCALIRDAGRTQLEPGTITALGLGPAEDSLIDKYVGNLKLL